MRSFHSYTQTITTNGSGAATVYFGSSIAGRVVAIKYEPGSSQIATGADLTITGETSGVPILAKTDAGTATVWYFPKTVVTESSDASSATDAFTDVYVFGERIKLAVAQGGDTKTGSMTIYTEEGWTYSSL